MSYFIIGAGGHSKSIISSALLQGLSIEGILDISPKVDKILGCDVYDEINHKWSEDNYYFIALQDLDTKKRIISKIEKYIESPKFFNIIHPNSIISNSAELGLGVCILANSYIGPDTVIGNHACINTGCTVEHDCKIGDLSFMAPSVTIAGSTKIGVDCFLGLNATIVDSIYIADNTIIGASSLVLSNINKSGQRFAGIPAKPI